MNIHYVTVTLSYGHNINNIQIIGTFKFQILYIYIYIYNYHFRELKSVTEYYVPEDQFQQSEDLAGNDNEELMDELMAHKHMFPY